MVATGPAAPVSPVEAEVRRIRTLVEQRRFAESLAAARALRVQAPENRDVLYLVAVCERYLGRVADALRTLEDFAVLHPDYGRLFQERGHCLKAVGETPAAIAAYQQAVMLNTTLVASWNALGELFRAQGKEADARMAIANAATVKALPAPVVQATNLLSEGDIHGAERLVRNFLLAQPDHIEAMRLLARIGVQLEVLDDAEFLLESLLSFAPDYRAARHEYGAVLVKRHKYARALEEAQTLMALEPGNHGYRVVEANARVGLGQHEEALEVYRQILPHHGDPATVHLSIAHAQKTLGRQEQAIESYRASAAAQPGFGDAWWSLANLKTYRFTDAEIAQMQAFLESPRTGVVDRFHLCFALGKACEDRGDYPLSFRCYERGNAIKKRSSSFRIAAIERNADLQAQVCTHEFFERRAGSGCASTAPIFIVGLPRAGSTLLEQILASHSQVEGTMELAEIPRLAFRLQGRGHDEENPRYPGVLAELDDQQLREFGETYLRETAIYRSGKPFFIDKMPNNFRHIGLMHLILPNARIIDARRNPMACCFSNFKQLFASGQEFSYGIDDIARYYRSYVGLMQHWDTVLPGKVLRVQHEEVVQDLEGSVRRILDFLGLPFERSCLEFYNTERSVRTASSEQVRRPIYTEGLEQWRHYEPWLGPLREALGPLAER